MPYRVAPYHRLEADILSGQTKTGELATGEGKISAILFPAAFTGATVSFEGSTRSTDRGGVFAPIHDDGGVLVTVTPAVGKWVVLTSEKQAMAVAAFPFIKIVSASAEGADRALEIALKS